MDGEILLLRYLFVKKIMAMSSVKHGEDFPKTSPCFTEDIAMIWKHHRHDFFLLM
jgi:hypothetical protein